MPSRFHRDLFTPLFRAFVSGCIVLGVCSACSKSNPPSGWKANPATATQVTDSSGVSAAFFLITYNSNIGFKQNEINHRRLSCSISVDLGPAEPPPLIYPTLEILELKDFDGVDLIPATEFSSGSRTKNGDVPSYGLWTFSGALEAKPAITRRTSAPASLEASGAPDGRLAGLKRVRARLTLLAAKALETVDLPLTRTEPIPLGKDYTIRIVNQPGDKPSAPEAIIERVDGSPFTDAREAPVCLYRIEVRASNPKYPPKAFVTRGVFTPSGIVLRFERPGYPAEPLFAAEDTLVLSFVTSYDKRTLELEATDIPL